MTDDKAYQEQRIQLLAKTLKMLVEKNWWGIQLSDLANTMNLGEWETQHLFEEYLQKDPLVLVQDIFNPIALSSHESQLSIFDVFTESNPRQLKKAEIDLNFITTDPEHIYYAFYEHFLGQVCIASSEEGLVQLTFEDAESGLSRLVKQYPKSKLVQEETDLQRLAFEQLITLYQPNFEPIVLPVAVKCSPFQEQVWNALIGLEPGSHTTYGDLAEQFGDKKVSRAVGTAIGLNPIAVLIPCHRVLNQTGKIGHFRWGTWRKQVLLGIEK